MYNGKAYRVLLRLFGLNIAGLLAANAKRFTVATVNANSVIIMGIDFGYSL